MSNSKVVYLDLPRPVDPADIELENGILEGFRQLPDYLQDAVLRLTDDLVNKRAAEERSKR
ncbi:hypothetical protein [uncultured Pseudomonas sp.]|uniref:hypothetical protein n=1 Tax=uncultured Pseudomonas sp. TaxID=114707 RepID=UPI0025D9E509|nr:hypothetical protein [uncultured Pseudomonas sp.]